MDERQAIFERAQALAHLGTWIAERGPGGRVVYRRRRPESAACPTRRSRAASKSTSRSSIRRTFDRVRAAAASADTALEPFVTEVRIVRADGTERWVRVHAEVAPRESPGPNRVIGTVQDITEQKQIERYLTQRHRLDALGQLAGGVAHDFNNLLTIVSGNLDLIEIEAPTLDRAALFSAMRYAIESGARLTAQLLAFSREKIAPPGVIDLNDTLRRLMGMLRRTIEEYIEVHADLAEDLWPVRIDSGAVEQIVVNLAVNARDAMPQGGRLEIVTRNTIVPAALPAGPKLVPTGAYVTLVVRDTGTGMDAATQERVFEPFFSTKGPEGTGLGLATVYGLVRQCGGHVRVDSAPGEGCAFTVYLPRTAEPAGRVSAASTEAIVAPAGRPRRTVLLVEDNDSVRETLEKILHTAGYEVFVAASSADALTVAQQHAGAIDLLVSDIVLAAMNGPALAQVMAPEHPAIKVLFISGYTNALLNTADRRVFFLAKAFSAKDLLATVDRIFAS